MFSWTHFISGKFRRPDGFFGRRVSRIMYRHNRAPYDWVFSVLDIGPDDRVLEIGFGPGYGLSQVLPIVRQGRGSLTGIDFSKTMCAEAARAVRGEPGADAVRLELGEARDMPFEDNAFTRVFAINVLYFWPDLVRCFEEVFRVTAPGGKATFFYSDKESLRELPITRTGHFHFRSSEDTEDAARRAGFEPPVHAERLFETDRERLGRLITVTVPS